MQQRVQQLKRAQAMIESCLSSLPYTPPEMADATYFEYVAGIFNELDPLQQVVLNPDHRPAGRLPWDPRPDEEAV